MTQQKRSAAHPDWNLLQSFLQAYRTGSFSAAADALGITQPTVARHVRELEAHLDTVLFTRSNTGLVPTDDAERIHGHSCAIEASVHALQRVVTDRGDPIAGVVRVAVCELFGTEVVPRILAALHREHPALAIEVCPVSTGADILQREADIALRAAPPVQNSVVQRRLGSTTLGLFGHRDILAAHGEPQTPQALAGLPMVGFDRDPGGLARLQQLGVRGGLAERGFRSDSLVQQFAAIRAGLGIGLTHPILAAVHPQLVRVLGDAISISLEYPPRGWSGSVMLVDVFRTDGALIYEHWDLR